MKKKITFLLASLFAIGLFAQQPQKMELRKDGTPRLILFDAGPGKKQTTSVNDVNQLFKTYLKPGDQNKLKALKTEKDNLGYSITTYQQYFKGIKVEFGQYSVNVKDGACHSIHGEFKKIDASLSVIPKLSEKQALESALQYVGAETYMWEDAKEEQWAKANTKSGTFYPRAELVIVGNRLAVGTAKDKPTLAYKFDIYAKEPHSRAYIYIDAQTGETVMVNTLMKNTTVDGNVSTRYSGTKKIKTDFYDGHYRLRDYSQNEGIIVLNMKNSSYYSDAVDFTDADNNWTESEYDNAAKDNAALESAWAFQVINDYWKNKFDRNSFDNNGTTLYIYDHYQKNLGNAYWTGQVFLFGDGDDIKFDALTALDISAHEYGHAVCQYTAHLVYQDEPGALNEGLSDIWGAAVEYYGAPTKKTWVLGEDVEMRSGHEGLRVLSNPKAEGLPDTYKGTYWYTAPGDYGGVHFNCGPITYWFYLISAGGSGTNDNGTAYNIQGLGIEKAEKIVWRTESVYLTANSDYSDFRKCAIQAARDIYGEASNEVIQITNAFAAIGVGDGYDYDGNITYCTPTVHSSNQWISLVNIGTINNISENDGGYHDYTDISTIMSLGSKHTINMVSGWATSSTHWVVWIDFNRDGDFTDDGEEVIDNDFTGSNISTSIAVPYTAATGSTRMRVMMRNSSMETETPCELYDGEIEDYMVNIIAAEVAVTGVKLSSSSLSLTPGKTASLTATVTPSYASNRDVTWSSGNTKVATVDANGVVTAIDEGSTIITVTTIDGHKTSTCTVTVTLTIPVTDLTLNAKSYTLVPGEAAKLIATVIPSDATNQDVTWSSSNTDIATVDTNGIVTAKAAGIAVIVVTTMDGSISHSCAINVVNPITYCIPSGHNSNRWIRRVKIGTINNGTANDCGYGDYTSLSTFMEPGSSQTIELSPATVFIDFKCQWMVWIDYNQDGDFTDSGELIIADILDYFQSTVSYTFTVPSDATVGATRMRVIEISGLPGKTDPCGAFESGEVEDYTVIIAAATAPTVKSEMAMNEETEPDSQSLRIYPNPVDKILFIDHTGNDNIISARVLDMNGIETIIWDRTNDAGINVSSLSKGMYILAVKTQDGEYNKIFIKK